MHRPSYSNFLTLLTYCLGLWLYILISIFKSAAGVEDLSAGRALVAVTAGRTDLIGHST